ncbi:MAG: MBL fold metallo-hydrolase [Christensenella sp.]
MKIGKAHMFCMKKILAIVIVGIFCFAMGACSSEPYIVTQYADVSGNQSMFYSIKTPKDKLIMVDGGFAANAEQVREVINANGGRVDHWILTHPHPDHIEAFNAIFEAPQGIEIEKIYASDIDYDYYKEHAQDYDGFSAFEKFRELVADYDKLTYLYAGDSLETAGLRMDVFNAAINVQDPCNDGSLMFKLTGKEQSILFCGDVGARRSEDILMRFGEQLPADYIQMGHHGNGGLSSEFYQKVHPSIAFFDAPDWLMNNINPSTGKTETWTTPENKKLMESMGCKVLSYNTSPNTVELF